MDVQIGSNPNPCTCTEGYSYLAFCHPSDVRSILISCLQKVARGFGMITNRSAIYRIFTGRFSTKLQKQQLCH